MTVTAALHDHLGNDNQRSRYVTTSPARIRPVFGLLLLMILFCLTGTAIAQTLTSQTYRLANGDVFDVYVLDEEDLSITATVNDEGTIFFPLLGEVPVAGMTPDEVETDITRRLKGDYLVKPIVSVTMSKYREYFIGGAVNAPGWYEYKPDMTFQQAVDTAGGFNELASKRKIYVHHENETTEQRRKVTLDHRIMAGDSLFVDESFF